MRIAVISDIQSNLEALKAVLKDIKKERISDIYCCGNIVGYNASPSQCVQLVQKRGIKCVQGDYDFVVVALHNMERFTDTARAPIMHAVQLLKMREKKFLAQLPLRIEEHGLTIVHGSPRAQEGSVDSNGPVEEIARQAKTPIVCVGHTHRPFALQAGARFVVSPGSVGQPRDGDWRASYAIINTQNLTASIRRVEYDVRKAAQKIIKAGLPAELAERLQSGL